MNRWMQNDFQSKSPARQNTTERPNTSEQSGYDFTSILRKAKESVNSKWTTPVVSKAKLSDFEIIKTIGHGTFGKVKLVRHLKGSREYYAMKVVAKRSVIRLKSVHDVILEKKILSCIQYPFIIEYIAHFKNNANLFIVMECCIGGEVYEHLRRQRKFEENLCQFYAAQVVLALEYLHFVGIVFRDLKPENLVLDRHGYLKITDFGLAKKIDRQKTLSMVGTPEYYAPEIIKQKPYSYPVDWYTLGILIYEMTSGRPPYLSSNPLKLYGKILEGRIKFPAHFSNESVDIIKSLTKQSSYYRLSVAKLVKAHDYFENINWLHLYKKIVKPPFVPIVVADDDTQNFDKQVEEPLEEDTEDLFVEEFKDF